MKEKKFKKLDIDLPVQPISNPRPWFVAGWLFVLIIVVLAAWAYLER